MGFVMAPPPRDLGAEITELQEQVAELQRLVYALLGRVPEPERLKIVQESRG